MPITQKQKELISLLPLYKDLTPEQQKQDRIDLINDWAIANPQRVLGDDFLQQRQYLTLETWRKVIPELNLSENEILKNKKIPDTIKSNVFNNSIRKATSEAAKPIAAAMLTGASMPVLSGAMAGVNAIRTAPIIQKGFQLARLYGKQGFNWLSQQADKAFPWIEKNILPTLNKLDPTTKEFAAMGLAGKLGVGALESAGLYEAGRAIQDFVLNPSVSKIPEATLSAMTVLPYAQVYNAPYKIASLPGYMLKQLMPGSKLEKALSKVGTIDVNSIRAMFKPGNANESEIEIINNVLNNVFAGLSKIDYNAFRKAVQDEIITYTRKPLTKYAAYGMDRLGYDIKRMADGAGGLFDYVEGVPTVTFTFESNKIPYGNAQHYDLSSLGHSRTYTTPEEPKVLHVMESQSDWGQHKLDFSNYYSRTAKYLNDPLAYLVFINRHKNLLLEMLNNPDDYRPGAIESQINNIKRHEEILSRMKNPTIMPQEVYLHNNYLQRLLQENMRYAAELGKTKMRYPTSETAAKIEGFQKNRLQNMLSQESRKRLKELNQQINLLFKEYRDKVDAMYDLSDAERFRGIKLLYKEYKQRMWPLVDERNNLRQQLFDYLESHKTILKKYSDFPKLYKKIFKSDPVIVTDTKGNTWYEVDVPQGYLNLEWQYKNGGTINYLNLF